MRKVGVGEPALWRTLYDFRSQEQPTELAEPCERLTFSAARERERGKTFLCGSCQKSLPIDMFTRSQFQKAAAMDDGRGESESHLVRRCNECVTQPCCACSKELPLTAFANSQMLRPQGSRRCRVCASETWWCIRCARPRAQSDFSSFEARKGKRIAKVCQDCNKSNTYFDRRHALLRGFQRQVCSSPVSVAVFFQRDTILHSCLCKRVTVRLHRHDELYLHPVQQDFLFPGQWRRWLSG